MYLNQSVNGARRRMGSETPNSILAPELLMTIDQVDLVDSRAWLTSELWSSELRIMVSEGGPAGFYNEIGVITDYDDIEPCCIELIINSN